MASDETNAGGTYQFVEPQGGCIVPRMGASFAPAGMATNGLMAYVGTWKGVELREVFIPRTPDPDWTARAVTTARRWYDDEAAGD